MTDKEVRRKSDYVLVPSPEATQILIDELRSRLSAAEARLEAVKAATCSMCHQPMDTPGCSKNADDPRPRALAGFHTIAGPGPVSGDEP